MAKNFLKLYDDYYPKLYAYALMRVRRKEQAEDLVQQTFLKALPAYDRFVPRSQATEGSWLFRILKNELINQGQRESRIVLGSTEMLEAHPAESSTLEEILLKESGEEQHTQWQKVLTVFQTLSEEERELITLKYLADLPYKAIAKTMQKRPNTLAVMLGRSLEKIRKALTV